MHRNARLLQARRQFDDFSGRGFGIIGIDQQDEIVGSGVGECRKGRCFVVVRLDEGVGHRSEDRNSEILLRKHRRRSGKSRQITGARGHQPGLGAMGPSQPEIDQLLSRGRKDHSRRLGGDHRLKVKDVDEPGFDQLRLRKRRGHPNDRFVREEDGAFRHGIDVAGKSQAREVVEERVREAIALPKPIDLFLENCSVLEKVDGLLQPRRHEEAPASRKPTHEELEYGGIGLPMIQIRLKHVQLIQIGQQRARRGIHRGCRIGNAGQPSTYRR